MDERNIYGWGNGGGGQLGTGDSSTFIEPTVLKHLFLSLSNHIQQKYILINMTWILRTFPGEISIQQAKDIFYIFVCWALCILSVNKAGYV